jgi:hypothetical protein
MHFFYVLINGVTWKIASKLSTGNFQYEKTLNRIFNKLSNESIFKNIRDELTSKYINNNVIKNLKIDSTDIINGNCNKKETDRSWKLHKQAIKATFITDSNNIPLSYSLDNPKKHDSKVGYDLILNSKLTKDNSERIYISGDKGYTLNKDDAQNILKSKNIVIVTPKKTYKNLRKKNKYYKRKIVRHSKQMKESLKERIYIEHFNSILHRSYKRLDKIYDKTLKTFSSFINIALSVIILRKLN